MTIRDIDIRLREVPFNYRVRNAEVLTRHLADHKRELVSQGDQQGAKAIWCLEQTLITQEKYLEAFRDMAEGRFYAGWCALERVEIEWSHLRKHLTSHPSIYSLDFILEKTRQWQTLFPYRLFLSPGYLVLDKECGVCGEKVRLRGGCSHHVGEIYDGEMCCHKLVKVDMKEVSLTPHPRQKYSVAFIGGGSPTNDNYNYGPVAGTANSLDSPFREWTIDDTPREIPIRDLGRVKANDACPCGSTRRFKRCCAGKATVRIPWAHVTVATYKKEQRLPTFLASTIT